MMEISQTGINLIKSYESCKLTAYQDGGGVWTIGYGHTGDDVHPGDVIDQDRANDLLVYDIKAAQDCIDAHVEAELSQGQYDALCSFVFNLGCHAFKTSTMCNLINAGNYQAARKQFARWNHDNGVVVEGLTARRTAEAEMFA